jgi:hypothetical protein
MEPLLDGAAARIALARKSKIDPLFGGVAGSIALARKSKPSPLVSGLAASIALGGIGVVSWAVSPANAAPETNPHVATAATASPALAEAERMRAGNGVSRSRNRATAAPNSTPSRQKPQAASSPTKPPPVAGLSQSEMDNAAAIVKAGQQMNLPRRAHVVAIATALQESHLRNLANPGVPGSLNHPNEGVGQDHDSIGLFQQRPNWGSVDQLMDPQEAARRFYAALVTIPGWDQLSVTVAAQRVQVSAFPDAYAQHQGLAEQIVDSILA